MTQKLLDDLSSFLVPTYRFRSAEHAMRFVRETPGLQTPTAYAHADIHKRTYVPRKFQSLSTGLLTGELPSRNGRVQQLTIRRANEPIPLDVEDGEEVDADSTCLMVDGARHFMRYQEPTSVRSADYYAVVNEPYHCFAAWGRDPAHPLGNPLFVMRPARIFVGRHGTGALYTHLPTFNDRQDVTGFETRVLLISFSVVDRDEDENDFLRLTVKVRSTFSQDPRETPPPPSLDPRQHSELECDLARRAHEGFIEVCTSIPPNVEKLRVQTQAKRRLRGMASYTPSSRAANRIAV